MSRTVLTQTTQAALSAFKAAVPDLEAAVRVAFGKSSPEHESFFPHGLTEYHQATLTTAPALMERLVSLAQTHQAALGAAIVTRITSLKAGFQSARQSQVATKGKVSELKATSQELRHALERRLWKNALLLASEHLDQPEQTRVFFDSSRLKLPRKAKAVAGETTPPV